MIEPPELEHDASINVSSVRIVSLIFLMIRSLFVFLNA